jgi:triosephosphate isomerase
MFMNKALRKTIIAGNWKMNKTRAEAEALIGEIIPLAAKNPGCETVICVPFTNIETALRLTAGTNIGVGAQNCHFKKSGAFTGEISTGMLADLGVKYVIIGHSERRQYFNETDLSVNRKIKAALSAGLIPIVCVGESLSEREDGVTEAVVELQTRAALTGVAADDAKKIVVAYEPVWAIGTGKTATDEQAEEVCAFIRGIITNKYGNNAGDYVTIQYGGSMNASNAAGLLAKPDIDGGLIGGASLKAADFGVLLGAANG